MGLNTSYTAPTDGANGQLAYLDMPFTALSRAVETAAGIGFGRVVSRGTDTAKQVLLGGAVPFGIVLRSHEFGNNGDDEDYDQYTTCPVLRAGYVWVTMADTATAGAVLNYNTTTGAIGAGSPGGGEAALPGELVTNSTAGGLAIIWIDCQMSSTAYLFGSQVLETDYDAYTILAADTDNTPAALTVGASTFVGRKATGGISAMSVAESQTLLGAFPLQTLKHVKISAVDMKTDESEQSAALGGSASKVFVPIGYALKADATGALNGDGTLNIGTSAGGTQIVSAGATTGLTADNALRYTPLAANTSAVLGNATIYANVEAAETGAGTLALDVYLVGFEI